MRLRNTPQDTRVRHVDRVNLPVRETISLLCPTASPMSGQHRSISNPDALDKGKDVAQSVFDPVAHRLQRRDHLLERGEHQDIADNQENKHGNWTDQSQRLHQFSKPEHIETEQQEQHPTDPDQDPTKGESLRVGRIAPDQDCNASDGDQGTGENEDRDESPRSLHPTRTRNKAAGSTLIWPCAFDRRFDCLNRENQGNGQEN